MPVYLLHGFRWPRALIRIHIILQNLDDAAAEWLCSPMTTRAMLANFHQLYPDSMPNLPNLRFIEQYDPEDVSPGAASQPYAYVADVVEEIKLGVEVDEVRGKGMGAEQWESMMELRDRLAPEEKVAWWVVVCGDEERWAPPVDSDDEEGEEMYHDQSAATRLDSSDGSRSNRQSLPSRGREQLVAPQAPAQAVQPAAVAPPTTPPATAAPQQVQQQAEGKGFKKFFGSGGRSGTPKKRKSMVKLNPEAKNLWSVFSLDRGEQPPMPSNGALPGGAPAQGGPEAASGPNSRPVSSPAGKPS